MSPNPAAQAPSHVGRWLSTPTSKLSSPVILTGGHTSLSTPTSHTPTSALVQDLLQKSGCPQIRPSDNFPQSGASVTPGQGRGQCLLRLSTLLPEGGIMAAGDYFATGDYFRAQASPGPQPNSLTLPSASTQSSPGLSPRPRHDYVANAFHSRRRIWSWSPSLEKIWGK